MRRLAAAVVGIVLATAPACERSTSPALEPSASLDGAVARTVAAGTARMTWRLGREGAVVSESSGEVDFVGARGRLSGRLNAPEVVGYEVVLVEGRLHNRTEGEEWTDKPAGPASLLGLSAPDWGGSFESVLTRLVGDPARFRPDGTVRVGGDRTTRFVNPEPGRGDYPSAGAVLVDGQGRIRRIEYEPPGPSQAARVVQAIEFSDFGVPVDDRAPV